MGSAASLALADWKEEGRLFSARRSRAIKHVLVSLHSIALIWPSEWERIQKLFVVDHVIKITRTRAAGEPESALYSSEPRE